MLNPVAISMRRIKTVTLIAVLAGWAGMGFASSPVIITQPQSQSVGYFCGCSATFTVVATGTEPLSYQWRRDGVALAAPDSPSLVLSNALLVCGDYSVVVSNKHGAVESATAVLTVLRLPNESSVFLQPVCPHTFYFENEAFETLGSVFTSAPYVIEWRLNGMLVKSRSVLPLSGNCASNQVVSQDAALMTAPVGENVVELSVRNAVGSAARSFSVVVLPYDSSTAAGGNSLSSSASSGFCMPMLTLGRGLPGISTDDNSGILCNMTVPGCRAITNAVWFALVTSNAGTVTVSIEGSASSVLAVLKGQPTACSAPVTVKCTNGYRLQFQAPEKETTYFAVVGRSTYAQVKLTCGYDPQIASFGMTNGNFELDSTAGPPLSYSVLASTNLLPGSWSNVFTASNGSIHFVDPGAATRKQRFYRLVPGP
jgi:hypothetical protein